MSSDSLAYTQATDPRAATERRVEIAEEVPDMSNYLMINAATDVAAAFGAVVVGAAFTVNVSPKHRQLASTGMTDGRTRRPPEIPL